MKWCYETKLDKKLENIDRENLSSVSIEEYKKELKFTMEN